MKTKTILIIIGIILLTIVFYEILYRKYSRNLIIGNPIFNENIKDSKYQKMFIFSYRPIGNQSFSFSEIWLERKGYYNKEKPKIDQKLLRLNFSFKNKPISDLRIVKTNFYETGYGGYSGEIFNIETQSSSILEKDTLYITFFPNNEVTLVRD